MIFTHVFVSYEEADLSNYEWLVVMKTTSVVPAILPKAMAYAATQMGVIILCLAFRLSSVGRHPV